MISHTARDSFPMFRALVSIRGQHEQRRRHGLLSLTAPSAQIRTTFSGCRAQQEQAPYLASRSRPKGGAKESDMGRGFWNIKQIYLQTFALALHSC